MAVVRYLGQIITELNLPWAISTDKMLNDGDLVCQGVQVLSDHGLMLYGEISRTRSIDEMRQGLIYRIRQRALNRHYVLAFLMFEDQV